MPLHTEEQLVNLGGDPNHPRCPATNRPYEVGAGALPHDQQTAMFVRERDLDTDKPIEGERCLQTGREFECGSGCLPKSAQTRNFLNELPPEHKAARRAAFDALVAAEPAGKA